MLPNCRRPAHDGVCAGCAGRMRGQSGRQRWAHSRVPRIADMLLSRAYLRSYTWWYRCLDDFARYRDVCPGPASPSKREGVGRRRGHVARGLPLPGSEGGAHARTRRSASGGGHRRGQGRLGAKRGRAAAALLVLGAGVAAGGACRGHGVVVRGPAAVRVPRGTKAALLCVCGAAMASGVVCDLRARVIPLECCAALSGRQGAPISCFVMDPPASRREPLPRRRFWRCAGRRTALREKAVDRWASAISAA